MSYGYQITAHGQALQAACLDLGLPLKITRAAVGSGTPPEGTAPGDIRQLIRYVADVPITERRHEEDRLYLTVQYANSGHPETEDFVLSEIMAYAQDPRTGQETDFLYATLGDYRQPVPAYCSGAPASVWSFPMVLAVSSELQVNITASPGLVTSLDLQEAIERLTHAIMVNELVLPLATAGGEPVLTASGAPMLAVYHPERNAELLAALEAATGQLSGQISQMDTAVRAYADGQVSAAVAAHNADNSAHPAHLMAVTQ